MTNFFTAKLSRGGAVLAPMAGFTDAPFRKLCREFGSAWAVTEMVSAKGLMQGGGRGLDISAPYAGERDLVIQIFGSEPEVTAEAGALLVETYKPAALDLNMGCPVKKILDKGCGAELMRRPERAAAIVSALKRAVPVPVSVKMRLGYDRVNAPEVARTLEAAGASALAVHGRTALQKYGGEADWEGIAEVAQGVKIPVIGSGDVATRAAFERYRALGLGVMVARAAVGRPWIFSEFRGEAALDLESENTGSDSGLNVGPSLEPCLEKVAALAYRHAALHLTWYGEERGLAPLRGALLRYFEPFQNNELRARLVALTSLPELAALIASITGHDPRDTHVPEAIERYAEPSLGETVAA